MILFNIDGWWWVLQLGFYYGTRGSLILSKIKYFKSFQKKKTTDLIWSLEFHADTAAIFS